MAFEFIKKIWKGTPENKEQNRRRDEYAAEFEDKREDLSVEITGVEHEAKAGDTVGAVAFALNKADDDGKVTWETETVYTDKDGGKVRRCKLSEANEVYAGDIISLKKDGDIPTVYVKLMGAAAAAPVTSGPSGVPSEDTADVPAGEGKIPPPPAGSTPM